MKKELDEAWAKAESNPGEAVDIGDIVCCDICGADYTDSDRVGGFQFESKAVCPECEPDYLKDVAKYGEERYIRAKAQPGETFRHFVLRLRGGVNTIRIDILKGFKQ
jgi:hypothetical protein